MSTINLLPDDYLKRRSQRRSNIVCIVLFAVVLSGVIGANTVTSRSERLTLEIRDRVNEEYDKATKLIQHMQSLERQKAVRLQKAELTASLVERMPRSTVLGIVATACPNGVSLKEVNLLCKPIRSQGGDADKRGRGKRRKKLSTSSRKSNGPAPVEVNMTISGLAETDTQVAKFIANLASSRPLIKDVNLVFSQEKLVKKDKDKDKRVFIREFEIKLQLNPQVDAMEMVKTIIERARTSGDLKDPEAAKQETVG